MASVNEYQVEELLLERLQRLGYRYVDLKDYNAVRANLREQVAAFNADRLLAAKGEASLSDSEFERVVTWLDNKTVYQSAKQLRDQYVLTLDNNKKVYLQFFSGDMDRNIYQVAHQITMDKDQLQAVERNNRYDVTILINGLPVVQIELKRPGVEINEAINQINRYRKDSFRGLFHYLQIFVVSNAAMTKYFCNEDEFLNGAYQPILKSLTFFWTDGQNRRINSLDDFAGDFLKRSTLTTMLEKYMVIKSSEPVLMVMRPYQIYAVRAAKQRVLDINRNGFVFACTGSGKTLTSFKLAQLLRDEPVIDKVIFLVDRKDLDDQTVDEYNSFQEGCVDTTDSTAVLVKQLQDPSCRLMVTTIQKMASALRIPKYSAVMDRYREKRVVFIIDECHRSQFGAMHISIQKHFERANYIGFTGTPIFTENMGNAKRTTADLFNAGPQIDSCLHRYMIADAIADGNVLPFSVEYQRTIFVREAAKAGIDPEKLEDPEYCKRHDIDINSLYHNDERIRRIAQHILEHHEQHVRLGTDTYTALFAVDSIPMLGKYYNELQSQIRQMDRGDAAPKVAAIFSYRPNEDMDEGADENSQALLEQCMKDYNGMFGTSFDLTTMDAYRKDIAKRMKQKEEPQIDILLVVNMFLTGFDARPCNTLYLDKNLIWHSLVQAYSRTNRIYRRTKKFGQIITYRNIKKWQDEALTLFSGDGDPNAFLLENYDFYVNQWIHQVGVLRSITPEVEDAGQLQSEEDIRKFILDFRDLARTLATLKTFSKFDWSDLELALNEADYDGFKSWYLYYRDLARDPNPHEKVHVPVDVDFDIELIRTDRINVMYILNLLKKINATGKTEAQRQADVDLVLREIERSDNESLRRKADVMKDFILNCFYALPEKADVMEAFETFEKERMQEEMETFATTNGIELEDVSRFVHDYFFSQHISEDDIRKTLRKYRLGLLRMSAMTEKIRVFVEYTYNKFKAEGQA